ncbi:hypothetical protein T12_1774 [Trichinella patagoniensis]|uniref:Uncharacterized protein n=1 Tax=Trichinella patagoniensis TaxID=990121 RepID=A0A0V0XG47_9BILA|nr:hypothetical protein T12_1774 [Trichinella patagoniensis]
MFKNSLCISHGRGKGLPCYTALFRGLGNLGDGSTS